MTDELARRARKATQARKARTTASAGQPVLLVTLAHVALLDPAAKRATRGLPAQPVSFTTANTVATV